MTDIEQFVLHLSDSVKSNLFSKKIPQPPWPRKSVSSLFKKHIGIKSFLSNFFFIKTDMDNKNNISPVRPYLTKLSVNGSMLSTTYLVKTKVDPPRVADKDAKKDPSSRVLILELSLFIIFQNNL